MSMSQKIKIVLTKRNMNVKDLAEGLNCSSQNISNKFKRDNFSEKELEEIGKILNCRFVGTFILNDTGEEV